MLITNTSTATENALKLDEYVTVLMQGYVQVAGVKVMSSADPAVTAGAEVEKGDPVYLTVISRRSVERPGLRYQRRGISAAGGTANFVETEFIVDVQVSSRHVLFSDMALKRGCSSKADIIFLATSNVVAVSPFFGVSRPGPSSLFLY